MTHPKLHWILHNTNCRVTRWKIIVLTEDNNKVQENPQDNIETPLLATDAPVQ